MPMMPLSLCSALYMKPTCRPDYAKRPLSLVHNIFDRLFRVLLLTAATPLLFTSSLLLLPLPLLLLLLAHFVSKSLQPQVLAKHSAPVLLVSCLQSEPSPRIFIFHITNLLTLDFLAPATQPHTLLNHGRRCYLQSTPAVDVR